MIYRRDCSWMVAKKIKAGITQAQDSSTSPQGVFGVIKDRLKSRFTEQMCHTCTAARKAVFFYFMLSGDTACWRLMKLHLQRIKSLSILSVCLYYLIRYQLTDGRLCIPNKKRIMTIYGHACKKNPKQWNNKIMAKWNEKQKLPPPLTKSAPSHFVAELKWQCLIWKFSLIDRHGWVSVDRSLF